MAKQIKRRGVGDEDIAFLGEGDTSGEVLVIKGGARAYVNFCSPRDGNYVDGIFSFSGQKFLRALARAILKEVGND